MYDSDESRMLGELQELDGERHLIMHHLDTCIPARVVIYNRILDKLDREKERLESRLRIHRQKVQD